MSGTDTANAATGLAGAADSFEALLAAEAGNERPERRVASEPAEAPEAEALDGLTEDETQLEGDEPEDGAEGEEVAATDDEAEEAPQEDQYLTIKIDGKEEKVSLEEAARGYQRQADYSRKTAALAEERRSFERDRQAVVEERGQYQALLSALSQQLQGMQPQEPDWENLYRENPLEYVRQKDVWRERQEKMAAAQYEMQRVQTLTVQEQQAQLQQMVAQGRQKLVEAVPVWKDPQRWETDRNRLLQYGAKLGFAEDELRQAYDPRAVVALYKAMQYDALMAKRIQPSPSRSPRPAAAGSAAVAPRQVSDVTRAKQRLAKTGKVADAAVLFEGLL